MYNIFVEIKLRPKAKLKEYLILFIYLISSSHFLMFYFVQFLLYDFTTF